MPPKRTQPAGTPPDLSTEKAHSVLSAQLTKLQELKGKRYLEARPAEDEWYDLTSKLVARSFGSGSQNLSSFRRGRSAGDHSISLDWGGAGIDHGKNQHNFDARLTAYESALRSSIAELELDLPDTGIKGVYEPGEEYEFYRDVTACLKLAQKEIFVIDTHT